MKTGKINFKKYSGNKYHSSTDTQKGGGGAGGSGIVIVRYKLIASNFFMFF